MKPALQCLEVAGLVSLQGSDFPIEQSGSFDLASECS